MSTTVSTVPARSEASTSAVSRPGRLMSLDLFRGATIAAMILVNNPGDEATTYWPLQHAAWNGWTPTDLIFPFFLFIVGAAMAFSFSARQQQGQGREKLLQHVLWRGLLTLALGIFLNGFPNRYHLDHLRFYGVLQRIAVCYVITAILELWTDWRTQLAFAVACLVGYWILMRFVPVPGFGIPTHTIPLLDPDRNIVAWLDRKLLMGHLYEGTRDPEGVLSTIPAIATSLFGLLTGKWFRSAYSPQKKALATGAIGWAAIIVGRIMNVWFPINKKLWTSSFVVFTAGLALICLALCYWLVDARQRRGLWARLILVFGTNAIASYFFAEVIAHMLARVTIHGIPLQEQVYQHLFAPQASSSISSLLYALTFVLVCWLAMAALYRKGILLKI
jgi:predicted acyltransferase